jgi:hypothetical protein
LLFFFIRGHTRNENNKVILWNWKKAIFPFLDHSQKDTLHFQDYETLELSCFKFTQIGNNENESFNRILTGKDVKTTSIDGTLDENVEDTKGVIIIRKSKKDRQHKDQRTKQYTEILRSSNTNPTNAGAPEC